jgi:eukaryotic-like serine/threonine-protein kinase
MIVGQPSAAGTCAADQAAVTLRIVSGPHQGEEFVFLAYNTIVVGRAPDAQWRMTNDPYFSRYHFRVEVSPPSCSLVDLGATNGVQVNGQRVSSVDLKADDRIECGDTVFAVMATEGRRCSHVATLDLPPERRIVPAPIDLAAAEPSTNPAFPPRIADYDVSRVLGRGGMGVVFHAVQRSTGREVALKLVRPSPLASAETTKLFLREAKILSLLRHPRIVEYLELGLHEDQMYLAMEYLPTLDFPNLLATQSRPKQIRLACGIVCRVLEALQHAHEQDVVHRDVKPANILVYKRGGRLLVKLADFGLAKNYLEAGLTEISCENNVRGTLSYIAPEQLLSCRYAKPPCDIYSVGVCLYRFLSGRLPYANDHASELFANIVNSKIRPLADAAPDLPAEICRSVHRALAREPGDRYSSAEHMRRSLLKFTVGVK